MRLNLACQADPNRAAGCPFKIRPPSFGSADARPQTFVPSSSQRVFAIRSFGYLSHARLAVLSRSTQNVLL